MRSYPFHLVNVFADTHFGGNPLAVFPKADGLTDAEMQLIARQFNLSETVFVFQSSDKQAVADLRIFTPNYELPLAGHPTLGSAFVLKNIKNLADEFVLNTQAKPVQVFVNQTKVQMRIQGFSVVPSQADKLFLAKLSGLRTEDIVGQAYFVNSGTQQILVEIRHHQALQNLQIDREQLHILNAENPFKTTEEPSIYYWIAERECVYSRMFFEQNLVMVEDSGTGSACANLGAYFAYTNQHPITKSIHQGDIMGRPNRLSLTVDDLANISVGGNIIDVAQGEFYLP